MKKTISLILVFIMVLAFTPVQSLAEEVKYITQDIGFEAYEINNNSVSFRWGPVSGAVLWRYESKQYWAAGYRYYIERANSINGEFFLIGRTDIWIAGGNSQTYTDSDNTLKPSETYYYRIAVLVNNEVLYSNTVTVTLESVSVSGFRVAQTTSDGVTFRWDAVTNAVTWNHATRYSGGSLRYHVERATAREGSTYTLVGSTSNVLEFTDRSEGFFRGGTYYYRLSVMVNTTIFTSDSIEVNLDPVSITGFEAVTVGSNNITFRWDSVPGAAYWNYNTKLPTDSYANQARYKIERADSIGGEFFLVAQTSSPTFNVTNVPSGVTYYYRVSAMVNNNDNTILSSQVLPISVGATQFTITATASPANAGTVSGAGSYTQGATVTLQATPNTGRTFDGWYEGSTRVSPNETYTFTATQNRTLEARFTQGPINITATASPANGGTVTGGGTFQANASVSLTATPNTGWRLDGWYEDNTRVSTNTTYTFTTTQNRTLEARFIQTTGVTLTPSNPTATVTIPAGGRVAITVSGGAATVESFSTTYDPTLFSAATGGTIVADDEIDWDWNYSFSSGQTLYAGFYDSTVSGSYTVTATFGTTGVTLTPSNPSATITIPAGGRVAITVSGGAATVQSSATSGDPTLFSAATGGTIVADDEVGYNWRYSFNSGQTLYAGYYDSTVSGSYTVTAVFGRTSDKPPIENPHSDWAEPELNEANEKGLIPPILQDPIVDLRDPITRVEFAGVVVLTYEYLTGNRLYLPSANPFRDTSDVYARMAYDAGLMVGVSSDSFAPNMRLNRETTATALTRVFKKWYIPGWSFEYDRVGLLQFNWPPPFADDADISDWARESVYFMASEGVILGVGNNRFAPRNVTSAQEAENYATATREQAIVIALRMVNYLG